ncbi:Actin-binding protein [Yarrowia sp. C11]|nr:Actin-binding protein [Yarrowia sp. C11]
MSLDLATNGQQIKDVYGAIVANDPEFPWAIFGYATSPTASSATIKVAAIPESDTSTLADFLEEFEDGKLQYGLVRVPDPHSKLPKIVYVGWCPEGVPDPRAKGVFNPHLNALGNLFHGYHVQVTARDRDDLTEDVILERLERASGAKYGATSTRKPGISSVIKTKPNYTTQKSGADEEDWGDAPAVETKPIAKPTPVESSYKPVKVDLAEIRKQGGPSTFTSEGRNTDSDRGIVGGSYKPVGKIDIAAIRAQGKGHKESFENTPIKTDLEKPKPKATPKPTPKPAPVVDDEEDNKNEDEDGEPLSLKDRMKAFQKPSKSSSGPTPSKKPPTTIGGDDDEEEDETPKSVKDRLNAFSGSGRLTEMPKPKVDKSAVQSRFTPAASRGTKPLAPAGDLPSQYGLKTSIVSGGSRDFASENGKTPGQIWAEKHGKTPQPDVAVPSSTSNVSSASDKFSKLSVKDDDEEDVKKTPASFGDDDDEEEEAHASVSALRGAFNKPAVHDEPKKSTPASRAVPPPPSASRGNDDDEDEDDAPASVSALRGAFNKPAAAEDVPPPPVARTDEDEDEDHNNFSKGASALQAAFSAGAGTGGPPPPPARGAAKDADDVPPPMPARHAAEDVPPPMPARNAALDAPPPPMPSRPVADEPPAPALPSRGGPAADATPGAAVSSKPSATVEYDYTKDEEGEIDLVEDETVTDIEFLDENWWSGTNSKGETGLFPSNYVKLKDGAVPTIPDPAAAAGAATALGPGTGPSAIALYDYDAAEDNELSFEADDIITDIEFIDDDWWTGSLNGKRNLFPSNFVELQD